MVLVTACLIFKWIHQTFLCPEDTKHKTNKLKQKRKALENLNQNYQNKKDRREEFVYKELESVKAVLDMRNEELGRLRREVEKLRLERRQGRGEDKETQTGSAAPD